MKVHLIDLVRAADPLQGRNVAREYLQARILGILRNEGGGDALRGDNWRTTILGRLDALAWDRVAADVRPFLERAGDVTLLTRENVVRLLTKRP